MIYKWKNPAGAIFLACALIIPTLAVARGRGGGNPGHGGGFFGWRNQTLAGTVSAVNGSGNSLTVQSLSNSLAAPITLLVPATTPIVRFSSTGLSGLKVGDTIEVAGLPITMQAATIQASTPSMATTTGTTTTGTTTTGTTTTGTTTTGTTTTGTTTSGDGDADSDSAVISGASANARGTVKSIDSTTSQVVVALTGGTDVAVNVPATVQIERQDQVTLTSAKVGDQVWAQVSVDAAGNVTAVTLQLKQQAVTTTTGTTTGTTTTGTTSG